MSDTTTITEEERAELIAHVNSGYMTISGDGLKRALAALEQAEAEVLRENEQLAKERDWLASHTADICASVYQESYDQHWWMDCEWIEAARKAGAVEGTE